MPYDTTIPVENPRTPSSDTYSGTWQEKIGGIAMKLRECDEDLR